MSLVTRLKRIVVGTGSVMITRKEALAGEWAEAPAADPAQIFLATCGREEDTCSPETIVADIYAARTVSNRGAPRFTASSS